MLFLSLNAQTPNSKITIVQNSLSFSEAIKSFEKFTGLTINYADALAPTRNVSLKFYNVTSIKALQSFLANYGMTYKKVGNKSIVLVLLPKPKNQVGHKLSGSIKEFVSGEMLIGCRVYNYANGRSSFTNEYGHFVIDLGQGENVIEYFYPGLLVKIDTLQGDRNYIVNQELKSLSDTMAKVIISQSNRIIGNDLAGNVAGSHKLTSDKIKWSPQLLGESDVLRSISSLPGVISGSEGMLGVYVRGGNLDENLVLLDGVPLFNAYHLYGIFSSFNSDIVKNADLLKGYFPAKNGGRLSSIININTKDGNAYKLKGSASISILSSKISFEGPILKDKTTFFVSLRRSYLDFLTQEVAKNLSFTDSLKNNIYYFYDANAKITHKFNKRLKLGLNFYTSADKGGFKQNTSTESIKEKIEESREESSTWGNTMFSADLSYLWGNNSYLKLKAYQTEYSFSFDQKYAINKDIVGSPNTIKDKTKYRLQNGVQDREVSLHLEKYLKWTSINLGTGIIKHKFIPGNRSLTSNINQSASTIEFSDNPTESYEAFQYFEWAQNFHRKTFLNIGLRNSIHFTNYGLLYTYPEPRMAIKHAIGKKYWLNAAATRNYQFFHLLNNLSLGLPSDLWVPSTVNIKPVQSTQYSAGINALYKKYSLSLEGFYKQYQNLLEYADGQSYITNNTNWENVVTTGSGTSYGLEFMAEKKIGRFRGWASYTWLHSNRLFAQINGGKAFPSRYDRRHNFSLTTNYQYSKNIQISAAWTYASGFAFTLPIGKYLSPTPQDPYREIFIYSGRNNERARANHRLDLSVSFKKERKYFTRYWVIGLFNAYNHHNPFFYQFFYNQQNEQELNSVSLLPIMPNLSYTIQF